jgi:TonB family protein
MDGWLAGGAVLASNLVFPVAARAQDALQTPSASQSAEAVVADRPTVGIDPQQPPRIGAAYYPKESLRRKEQGTAMIRLYAAPDGSVPASQVVVSSGFARLDEASLVAFVDAKVRPAILHGRPISKWINVPTQWTINQPRGWSALDSSVTPHMPDDYQPEIGRAFYRKTSLDMRQEGTCLVHFQVSEGGTPGDISITKSTGFATLDQACITAIQDAQFIAAKRADKYIAAWSAAGCRRSRVPRAGWRVQRSMSGGRRPTT